MATEIKLDDWNLDPAYSDYERNCEIAIHLKFPDYKTVLKLSPAERKKKIAEDLREKLNRLTDTGLFENYELIGSKIKPTGISIQVPLTLLQKLTDIDYISHIHIKSIDHATRVIRNISKLYCVKMTVVIEIEGQSKGLQSCEERLVLIKAESADDAYDKLNESKDSHAEPYLNYNGELVRWRIESFDDYHEIDLSDFDNLDNPEGIEVFSELKKRKLTPDRVWDGKL